MENKNNAPAPPGYLEGVGPGTVLALLHLLLHTGGVRPPAQAVIVLAQPAGTGHGLDRAAAGSYSGVDLRVTTWCDLRS